MGLCGWSQVVFSMWASLAMTATALSIMMHIRSSSLLSSRVIFFMSVRSVGVTNRLETLPIL